MHLAHLPRLPRSLYQVLRRTTLSKFRNWIQLCFRLLERIPPLSRQVATPVIKYFIRLRILSNAKISLICRGFTNRHYPYVGSLFFERQQQGTPATLYAVARWCSGPNSPCYDGVFVCTRAATSLGSAPSVTGPLASFLGPLFGESGYLCRLCPALSFEGIFFLSEIDVHYMVVRLSPLIPVQGFPAAIFALNGCNGRQMLVSDR